VPPWAALPVLTAPVALGIFRATASRQPPVLVGALKRSAELELWWALLWTLGVLL
jgi:hypothetical protein